MNGGVAPWLRISCRQRNPAGPTKDRDFPNDKFPSNDSDTRSTEPREHILKISAIFELRSSVSAYEVSYVFQQT